MMIGGEINVCIDINFSRRLTLTFIMILKV